MTPLRTLLKPSSDADEPTVTRDWDYQADVYNNRVLDDVPDERVASKSMRPTPSDNLPILTIPFSPSDPRHRLPTGKDLNERVLVKLLGAQLKARLAFLPHHHSSIIDQTLRVALQKGAVLFNSLRVVARKNGYVFLKQIAEIAFGDDFVAQKLALVDGVEGERVGGDALGFWLVFRSHAELEAG